MEKGLKEILDTLDKGMKEVVEIAREGTLSLVKIELVRQGILNTRQAREFIDSIPKFKFGKKQVKPGG